MLTRLDLTGKLKYLEEPYPSVTMSTTNPTWAALGLNPCLCSERPETNCLSIFLIKNPKVKIYKNVCCLFHMVVILCLLFAHPRWVFETRVVRDI